MPYVKKLVMHGFKSFAKETEILFGGGMNTIVGPNGSGKSNISDAICFVLGRLSIKSIRAAKAANLIYNGGKNNRPASEARVDMVFDNSDKVFAGGDEIKITRIVRRDGQSIYKIDGKTKTRQEVLDLLAQAGIDPYGFNIILQGEISRFVEMHSDERRKIIEDIAGISIYEIRKEKSLRELENTDEKLKEVNIILHDRMAYLKNLDKERSEALRYTNLEKAIKRDKASLIAKDLKVKENEKKSFENEISKKEGQIAKVKNAIAESQVKINELNKEIGTINESIEKATGIEQEKLHREITEAKASIAVLNVRIENCTEQLSSLENRTKQLEEDVKKDKEELKKLENEEKVAIKKEKAIDFELFKQKLLETANRISELANTISKLNISISGMIKERKNIIASYLKDGRIKESINELSALIGILESEGKKHETLADEICNLKKKIDELLGVKIGEEAATRNILLEISLKKQDIARMELIIKRNAKEKTELMNNLMRLKDDLKIKEKEGKSKEIEEKEIYGNFQKLFAKRNMLNERLRQFENELANKQNSMIKIDDEANVLKVARAKIDAEFETLNIRMSEFAGVETVELSKNELEMRIKRNEETLSRIGGVNMRALQVYESVKTEYDKIAEKSAKLQQEKQEIIKIIEEIDRKKKTSFMKTLNSINQLFSENFSKLSGKGQAWLEIENREDIFAGGLDIIVKIAKGKYMDISGLSGGEQVLVALSLIFAIQEYKPYCFYIFDEIDAALDKRNSERLAGLLNSYVKVAQCIIVTHNDAIISGAATLYGVSMQDGVSKIISLKV